MSNIGGCQRANCLGLLRELFGSVRSSVEKRSGDDTADPFAQLLYCL
jgi:hypothetical protein